MVIIMNDIKILVDKIKENRNITKEQLEELLLIDDEEKIKYLFCSAREVCDKIYGKEIYIRGLIEFTNYCKNDCLYCGIRRSNAWADRYRLTKEQILECCDKGYELGFRTFVLQGGEDMYYTDELICEIVGDIKSRFSDCAITLSIGEKSKKSYQRYFDAGADRYLLRHETADKAHYSKLHPNELLLENRIECLRDLKEIGFQVGCGFMVGSPYQTNRELAKDLKFGAWYFKGDSSMWEIKDIDDDGYVVSLAYKGAKASAPGSWGLVAKYYDQGATTYVDHTMNGYADKMAGFKGVGLFANYALAKNVVAQVEYYDLEQKEGSAKDVETLWTQVVFTF